PPVPPHTPHPASKAHSHTSLHIRQPRNGFARPISTHVQSPLRWHLPPRATHASDYAPPHDPAATHQKSYAHRSQAALDQNGPPFELASTRQPEPAQPECAQRPHRIDQRRRQWYPENGAQGYHPLPAPPPALLEHSAYCFLLTGPL